MRRGVFIYDERLSQRGFGTGHPLQPSRLFYVWELLNAYGTLKQGKVLPAEPASEEELRTFHTPDYIAAVKSLSRGERIIRPETYNFSEYGDNPPYPGMYEASILPVGASLLGARLLADGEADVAFSPSGGLHHAAPNYASGFCIFNDVVIAIKYLLNRGLRVAYVDIDAHHGDGVQAAFYDSDRVLTISLHEWGRYLFPGTGEVGEMGEGAGRGYSVNLPLYPYTYDEIYVSSFRQIVPPLVRAFSPDILVTQLGCDTHFQDPLTHLCLSTHGYAEVLKELRKFDLPWLALGGGGYDTGVVARCWTLAYSIMLDIELPDEIPDEFAAKYGLVRLHDFSLPEIPEEMRRQARDFALRQIARVKEYIFPIHGI